MESPRDGIGSCGGPTSSPKTPPVDFKAESEAIIADLKEGEPWLDSAKKELLHLDNIWTKVLNSPTAKYGRKPIDLEKKAASLRKSGFTVAPTPPPLRRFRNRTAGIPENSVMGDQDGSKSRRGEAKENDGGIPTHARPRRTGKASTAKKGLKSPASSLTPKIRKKTKRSVKSKRMAMAEENFRRRLLKTRN